MLLSVSLCVFRAPLQLAPVPSGRGHEVKDSRHDTCIEGCARVQCSHTWCACVYDSKGELWVYGGPALGTYHRGGRLCSRPHGTARLGVACLRPRVPMVYTVLDDHVDHLLSIHLANLGAAGG
jgi:hypothetical protein